MKKIFVNEKEFEFTKDNLPALIHGEDHAGASFYTISLIANLFRQGCEIIVLCGYVMAHEQFKEQIGDFNGKYVLYTKEKISDFKEMLLSSQDKDDQVFLLKNVELFDEDIVNLVQKKEKYIISGDFNKCMFEEKIIKKHFTTKIFFSNFPGINTPPLDKYEGFFVSDKTQSITKLKI